MGTTRERIFREILINAVDLCFFSSRRGGVRERFVVDETKERKKEERESKRTRRKRRGNARDLGCSLRAKRRRAALCSFAEEEGGRGGKRKKEKSKTQPSGAVLPVEIKSSRAVDAAASTWAARSVEANRGQARQRDT